MDSLPRVITLLLTPKSCRIENLTSVRAYHGLSSHSHSWSKLARKVSFASVRGEQALSCILLDYDIKELANDMKTNNAEIPFLLASVEVQGARTHGPPSFFTIATLSVETILLPFPRHKGHTILPRKLFSLRLLPEADPIPNTS